MLKSEKESKMNVLENLKLIGVSTLLVVGLAACDKPGPAESAGKKLDQAVDQAGNKIADTADKTAVKLGQGQSRNFRRAGSQDAANQR
jgi:hypothetical protein